MALHIDARTARGVAIFHAIFFEPSPMRSCLAAKPQDAHDNHYNGELEADSPAHQQLRPIGVAAAQHIGEAEQKHDRDSADAYGNNQIGCGMHLGPILGNKT
jgi:hypothetical protein